MNGYFTEMRTNFTQTVQFTNNLAVINYIN